jgi:predicted ATPase
MLGDKRLLRSIRARNILSFGPESEVLELLSLNVLIGPNGSGKSNLIDVISLLRAAPGNLLEPIQAGGGIAEWLWKGADGPPRAEIDATIDYPHGPMPLRHRMEIAMVGQRAELVDEAVENEHPSRPGESEPYFYYRYQRGRPVLNVKMDPGSTGRAHRELRREDLAVDQSVVAQRKDPDSYPEITYLGNIYNRIHLFRELNLGRGAPPRKPQPADLPADFLQVDAANLAMVLNDLEHRGNLRAQIVQRLKEADSSIEDFSTRVLGGTIQLFLHFQGVRSPVPATRLSDGTVRYLCLLAALCHPEPPQLLCIEEPELCLHPDLLPVVAELLIEASHRTQLIVTTHSDVLVDGLSAVPEAVIVCEKANGSTRMVRKSSEELAKWLADYGLGQLWRDGYIGGNRW